MKKLNAGTVYPKLRAILITVCLAYIFMLPVMSFSKIGGLVFVASNIWVFAAIDIVVFSLFVYAWFILSPRKKVVLFLRKFRNANTNQLFEKAIRSKGAKDYRLVTLDDESFVPFGASMLKILASFIVIVFSFLIVYTLYDNYQIWLDKFNDFLAIGNQQSFDLYYKPLFIFGLTPVFIGLVTFVVWVYGRLVSMKMKMHVSADDQISYMSSMVQSLKGEGFDSGLLRPRSSIITVIDDSNNEGSYTDKKKYDRWQKVVSELCDLADIVLLDFTSNTDPLIWELDYAKLSVPDKLIVTVPSDLDTDVISELTSRGIDPISYSGSAGSDAKTLLVEIKHKLNDISQNNLLEVVLAGVVSLCLASIYYYAVLPNGDIDNEAYLSDFSQKHINNDIDKMSCITAIQYVEFQILNYETNSINCNAEDNTKNMLDEFDSVSPTLKEAFSEFNSEFKNPATNIRRLNDKYNEIKKACFGGVDYKLSSLDQVRESYKNHMLSKSPSDCAVKNKEKKLIKAVDYDSIHVGYINNVKFTPNIDIHFYKDNKKDFIRGLLSGFSVKSHFLSQYSSAIFKKGANIRDNLYQVLDDGYTDMLIDQKSISLTNKSNVNKKEYLTIGLTANNDKDFINVINTVESDYVDKTVLESNEYSALKAEYVRKYGMPLSYDEVMYASRMDQSSDESKTRNLIKQKTSLAQCDKYSGTALYGNCVKIMTDAQRNSLEQYDNNNPVVSTFKPCADIEYESNKYGGCLSEMLGISYVSQGQDGSALYNDSCIAWANNGEFLSLCAFDGHYKALKTSLRSKFTD